MSVLRHTCGVGQARGPAIRTAGTHKAFLTFLQNAKGRDTLAKVMRGTQSLGLLGLLSPQPQAVHLNYQQSLGMRGTFLPLCRSLALGTPSSHSVLLLLAYLLVLFITR